MTDQATRLPHAALDLPGRLPKAHKIHRLLNLQPTSPGRVRLLEIGTGSGAIAHYFATRSGLDCEVDAVDVADQRRVTDGYRFQRVGDANLPFADHCFDVVISNHVIEHVGDRAAQLRHLQEIARVLRRDGIAYLATPNRWQVVEPHYRLAFLSWLPARLRTAYLRLCGKGERYDCEPLSMAELDTLLGTASLSPTNAFAPAIRATLATERKPGLALRAVAALPDWFLRALAPISPTHVYLLRCADPGSGHGG